MGFTIKAHGVGVESNGLSPMQNQLLSDPKPIRIGGAPTGAGKTYAFQRAVLDATEPTWVLFVVPTQALAKDILQSAEEQSIFAVVWDGNQSKTIRESGRNVWEERKKQVEELSERGGFLISTPESLGQLLSGRPQLQRVESPLLWLLQAKHWVFDEAHTISERGFGFMYFWVSWIAYLYTSGYENHIPKITLLSATHSNLWKAWFKDGDDSPLSTSLVSFIDETILPPEVPNVRMLHGDVHIELDNRSVTDLFLLHGLSQLERGQRVLVIYDSLYALFQNQSKILEAIQGIGMQTSEVYVVDGQDKQTLTTQDFAGFDSGLTPSKQHRLIIGTSAIEMGVNYPGVTCAFLDPGIDKAALLQRIGRVSRGDYTGDIWICTSMYGAVNQHIIEFQSFAGDLSIEEVRGDRNNDLRTLELKRAKALGSAYWSWLERQPGHFRDFTHTVHPTISKESQPGKQLNAIRYAIEQYDDDPLYTNALCAWLRGVDRELQQLRSFSPTVSIQFGKNNPVIEYSRIWVMRWLDCSKISVVEGVWVFPGSRDRFLRKRPSSYIRTALHPFLGEVPLDVTSRSRLFDYLQHDVSELYGQSRTLWKQIEGFIKATGLIVFNEQHEAVPGASGVL